MEQGKKPLKNISALITLTGLLSFIRRIQVLGTQSREGTLSWLVQAPYAEGRKAPFSKLCLFAISYHLD